MTRAGFYKVIAHFADGHEQVAKAANYNSAHELRRTFQGMYKNLRAGNPISIIDKRGLKIWPRPERTPSP